MVRTAILAGLLTWGALSFAHAADASLQPDVKGQLQKQLDEAGKAASFDTFSALAIEDGGSMPPLKCMKAADFALAVRAHDGSPIVKMGPGMAMFFRGYYAALPFTPHGYPIGEDILLSLKADTDERGAAVVKGTAAFTLGDSMVCNVVPVAEQLVNMLFKAGPEGPTL